MLHNYLEYLEQQVCKGNLLRFYQIGEPDCKELELRNSVSDKEEVVVLHEHSCVLR